MKLFSHINENILHQAIPGGFLISALIKFPTSLHTAAAAVAAVATA